MNEKLPPHAYVPDGPFGRPESHQGDEAAPAIEDDDWRGSRVYLDGFALFNAGYYWEAHEAWETLWHAQGRRGPTADLIKGLIKLAAAGVKVRQGQRHGILTHALRAGICFDSARKAGGQIQLGLDLDALQQVARQVADHAPADAASLSLPVVRVFAFTIEPAK